MKKVLIPVTNHATLGETCQANGTYSPELTHVVDVLNKAGVSYDIASIKGGAAPLYGTDIEDDPINTAVIADEQFARQIANTLVLSDIEINKYDAVFYPGGFGLLSDLALDEDVGAIAGAHYAAGGVIAAVCHGPAALLPITLPNGDKLLSSHRVTSFTREEEVDYNTINDIPFLLEDALARTAAGFSKVPPWGEYVVKDERVITGQNPASAHAVGAALVAALGEG
ncbi:type 1 glutamine amidotransferase domain-containing protein [Parahalioglobus pacificus]|uniref:Dihydroxyacetone kinase n=1 Tax=Parahalioglobus pacificus TaxID=930806 RepID=A0A919CKX5_9GAMM|nr:type 1 glutamine amidotransferase domain-containing protein [Halioglobus pacificus]NQY03821.1 type 1 glutamine amidotransferase domain-containing protein [Halieaceae bacterium]GHD32211.1 dihydroxyacetone kinase [Halioglobus pacificus]